MVLMYFSGVPLLHQIIAPSIKGMYGNSQREFGLLENLQNLILLTMVFVAARATLQPRRLIERIAFGGVTAFAILVFLEEIDYGLHIYEWVSGVHADDARETRNLHNVGDRTDIIKKIVDLGIFVLFVVVPWVFHNSPKPLIRHLVPDRFSTATVICSVLVSQFAHLLDDLGFDEGGDMRSNISEFREFFTYWLFALFLIELTKRNWGNSDMESQQDTLPEQELDEESVPDTD